MVQTALKSGTNFCQSQYTAGAAMVLAALINGILGGWPTASLPVLKSQESPIDMNVHQISWVMSQQFFSTMIASIPAGLLMDKYGSKKPLATLGLLIPLPSLILIYLANNWKMLLISRFISGLWVGSVNTIAPMYLSEISPPSIRGFMITMFSVSFRIGNIYALITALFVSYNNLPIIYSIPVLLFILVFPFIPESPHYHIKRNDIKAARKSLLFIRNQKTDDEIDDELKELEESVRKQMENKGRFIDLVSTPGNRRALLIVETLGILQKLSGLVSIITYLTVTLPKSILPEPMILVIIIEILRFFTAFISSLIIDRTGSRILLLSTSVLCGIMMAVTGLWYYVNLRTRYDISDYNWVPFVCIMVHCLSFTFGANCVCHNIRSELFPMNIKGKASAISCTITSLMSFLVSKMYLIIDYKYGMYVNFWIYSISSFAMVIFSSRYFIETKGKTLQQIQDELNKSKNNNINLQTIHL